MPDREVGFPIPRPRVDLGVSARPHAAQRVGVAGGVGPAHTEVRGVVDKHLRAGTCGIATPDPLRLTTQTRPVELHVGAAGRATILQVAGRSSIAIIDRNLVVHGIEQRGAKSKHATRKLDVAISLVDRGAELEIAVVVHHVGAATDDEVSVPNASTVKHADDNGVVRLIMTKHAACNASSGPKHDDPIAIVIDRYLRRGDAAGKPRTREVGFRVQTVQDFSKGSRGHAKLYFTPGGKRLCGGSLLSTPHGQRAADALYTMNNFHVSRAVDEGQRKPITAARCGEFGRISRGYRNAPDGRVDRCCERRGRIVGELYGHQRHSLILS
ncbi:unknown [Sinorhizobium phage PBC5]|nr:unknown [Sinorhizobium phage PBC5]